jgi:hypothetical protein
VEISSDIGQREIVLQRNPARSEKAQRAMTTLHSSAHGWQSVRAHAQVFTKKLRQLAGK